LKHFGLIGYPLSHSFSERFFTEKFVASGVEATYRTIELHGLDALNEVIEHYSLDGFNVTIPYKEKILNYLDEIDPVANEIEAVNCVKVTNGILSGYNTDHIGFERSLISLIHRSKPSALIFGNGGAARAVKYVLEKLHIPYKVVTRNDTKETLSYIDINEAILTEYTLLINTTPIGMYPSVHEKLPLPYHFLNKSHFAFDLIYNPETTSFLKACQKHGATILNGYDMLIEQAEESFTIFLS